MKTVREILAEVAEEHHMPVSQLLSKSRTNRLSRARWRAMYRIFTECTHVSYPEMGRRMGGLDHTTCLHGVRRYCEMHGVSYDAICALRGVPPSNSNHKRYGTMERLFTAYGQVMESARAVQ